LAIKYYFCAFCGKKTLLSYSPHPQIIEYFRLKIEDFRFAFGGSILKRPGKKMTERSDFHNSSVFNLQSSGFTSSAV